MVPEDQTERWMDMMGEDVDEALLGKTQLLLDAVGAVVDGQLGPARNKHRTVFQRLAGLHHQYACLTGRSIYVAPSLAHASITHHLTPGKADRQPKAVMDEAALVARAFAQLVDEFAAEGYAEASEATRADHDVEAVRLACAFERAMFAWSHVNARQLGKSQASLHQSQAELCKTLLEVKEKTSLWAGMLNESMDQGQRNGLEKLTGDTDSLASQLEDIMVKDGPDDLGVFVGAAIARGLRFGAFKPKALRDRDPAAMVAVWRVMPLEAICKMLETQAHMQEQDASEDLYTSATLQAMFPRARVQSTLDAVEMACPSAKLSHLVTVLDPSHRLPPGHGLQDVRVVAVPPAVKRPGLQSAHPLFPAVAE